MKEGGGVKVRERVRGVKEKDRQITWFHELNIQHGNRVRTHCEGSKSGEWGKVQERMEQEECKSSIKCKYENVIRKPIIIY